MLILIILIVLKITFLVHFSFVFLFALCACVWVLDVRALSDLMNDWRISFFILREVWLIYLFLCKKQRFVPSVNKYEKTIQTRIVSNYLNSSSGNVNKITDKQIIASYGVHIWTNQMHCHFLFISISNIFYHVWFSGFI